MIITITCPDSLRDDANHLAACLTGIAADLGTYVNASYTDGTDNYCVTAPAVQPSFLTRAATADFDVPEGADSDRALSALSKVVIINNGDEVAPIPAAADTILVYVGFEPVDAITLMGLSLINQEAN